MGLPSPKLGFDSRYPHMEILELRKGYARVEFYSAELTEAGSIIKAIAPRLETGVKIEIIPPIEFSESRGLWTIEMKLTRNHAGVA